MSLNSEYQMNNCDDTYSGLQLVPSNSSGYQDQSPFNSSQLFSVPSGILRLKISFSVNSCILSIYTAPQLQLTSSPSSHSSLPSPVVDLVLDKSDELNPDRLFTTPIEDIVRILEEQQPVPAAAVGGELMQEQAGVLEGKKSRKLKSPII